MVKYRRWQIYPNVVQCLTLTLVDCHRKCTQTRNWQWWKILGVPRPGAGHAFPRQRHMHRGRGGYLFLLGFSSLYDAIHGWMMGWMDGWVTWWKKLHEKWPRHLLLYVIVNELWINCKWIKNKLLVNDEWTIIELQVMLVNNACQC